MIPPLFLAAVLAVLALASGLIAPGRGAPARLERVRIDPGRDPVEALEALEGLGAAAARRIVDARREGPAVRGASDLAAVPGIGTRRIHSWHADLSFEEDR